MYVPVHCKLVLWCITCTLCMTMQPCCSLTCHNCKLYRVIKERQSFCLFDVFCLYTLNVQSEITCVKYTITAIYLK